MKIKSSLPRDSPSANGTFLQHHFYFLVTIAVLLTTLCGWFRINTWCIVLLAGCRLWNRARWINIRKAFSNKLFIAYCAFFALDLIGQAFTPDQVTGWKVVAREATLVAIPFVLCAGEFSDERSYKRLMSYYNGMLGIISVVCLLLALSRYRVTGDVGEFFYHPLVSPISQNAIFFSVFVLFGLLFLLSYDLRKVFPHLPRVMIRVLQIALGVLLSAMVILLASKLFLVVMALILAWFLFRKYLLTGRRTVMISIAFLGIAGTVLLFFTSNPVKTRYATILDANTEMIAKERFTPSDSFNGIQLRLLEYRFAYEILNEQRAWVLGTTSGYSQDLLNQKYVKANMYLGEPGKKGRGFWDYNFHNQFVETLVRTGLVGLALLLVIFALQIGIVRRWRTSQAFFTILILIAFFIPQSPLTMQTGVFLFGFFPLLLLYSPKGGK